MKQRNQSRKGRKPSGQVSLTHPPSISSYQARRHMKLRFTMGNAFTGNVSFQNLLDTMLVRLTTTTLADEYYAVRVNFVEIWATSTLGGLAATILVSFNSVATGFVGDQKIHTDSSMGIEPAHVKARPSKRSLAAEYQSSSGTAAFHLEVPQSAVVDVDVDFIGTLGQAVAAQNTSAAGGTPGDHVTRGLDGLAWATTKFVTPQYQV